MSNFQLPKTTVLDASGNPVSGAKLYFYLTLTSTPESVYQDEALASAHANPVIADSAGRVAPIYLNPAQTYKLTVKDASDVTLYTVDPVKAYGLVGSDVSTRLQQIASNPMDYDADGTGAEDDATAVQSAINAATGTVDLLGKTYRCDSALTVPAGKRIINGTLDFSNCTTNGAWLVGIVGTYSVSRSLSTSANPGDEQLVLSDASGLAVGDWLRLYDNRYWYGSGATGIDAGELVRIKGIGGTTITLTSKVLGSYLTANSAQVARIVTKQNVTLEDLTIIGAQSVAQAGVGAAYAENLCLRNVKVTGLYTVGICLQASVHCSLTDCDVRKTRDTTNGVGIKVNRGSKHVTLEHCRVDDSPIGIEIGGDTSAAGDIGISRSIDISNCVTNGSTLAGIWLRPSQYVRVTGCTVMCGPGAASDGIVDNGSDNSMRNCTIRHATRYGAVLQPLRLLSIATSGSGTPASKTDETGTRFCDNVVELCGSDGVRLLTDANSQALTNLVVSRNEINGVGGYGIYVSIATQGANNVRLDSNIISGSTESPVYVTVAAAATLRRFSIRGNIAEGHGSTKDGIQLLGGDALSIAHGHVSSNTVTGGQLGLKISKVNHVAVQGNELISTADYGISVIDCSYVKVDGNDIAPTVGGIKYNNTVAQTDVSIRGNTVSGGSGYGILIDCDHDFTRVSVASNTSYGGTLERLLIDAASTRTIADLMVVGNQFNQGGNNIGPVHLTATGTITRFSIAANHLQNTAAAGTNYGISLDGGGTISNGAVLGNSFIGGNYGLVSSTTTVTACGAGGNYAPGLAASGVSVTGGAWTYAATSTTAADLPTLG